MTTINQVLSARERRILTYQELVEQGKPLPNTLTDKATIPTQAKVSKSRIDQIRSDWTRDLIPGLTQAIHAAIQDLPARRKAGLVKNW